MKTHIQQQIRKHIFLAVLLTSAGISGALVQAQTTIPATYRLPSAVADAAKPGFIWRTHVAGIGLPNTLARTEEQLAGLAGDNFADVSIIGPALAPAAPANPATAPVTYEIATVINLDQAAGSHGTFTPEDQLPGVPGINGSSDNIVGEALTWLDLPAGTNYMVVNSDDGFRVSIGGADPRDKFNNINVGQFDGGRGATDTAFTFVITQAGLYAARLIWEEGGGDANVEWFTQDSAGGSRVLINDVAGGGIRAYRAVTTPAQKAFVRTVLPLPGFQAVAPNGSIRAEIVDGVVPIVPTTVTLSLDGTPLSVTPTKAGNVTTVSYTPTALYASGSQHNVALVYIDGGTSTTQTWSFAVQAYATIPPTVKVTPDTTKPGFVWNVFANGANQVNNNTRTESALAGLLLDATGTPLPNLADPAAVGAALAASTAPNPANAPIKFEIATVINLGQAAATEVNGNFQPDLQMPGIPPTDGISDGIAAEILSYIELPAGLVTMGVNSDDGFRTTVGIDALTRLFAGEFEGGRGASDTIFNFFVQEAGVYPFRTIWEEGGGGANVEWFTLKTDGSKVLVNNVTGGGLKSYRGLIGTVEPYVKFVSPGTLPRQLNQVSSSVVIILADGTNPVNLNSVVLKIDGQTVTTTKVREGSTVRVTYSPTTLQIPTDVHSAELTFADTGTFTGTRQWQFRNLKNLVLPAPKITENFDSYPEDTQPTGWVAWNFTANCTPGRDITDQNSDSYKDWVLVSTANMILIDGGSANIAPGQTFNGQPVDGTTVALASGNVLYAESDSRCNTDALGGPNNGQTQFIISKAFDCSQITNVVLTLSALYTQNQDSVGAIEYSVNGGATWLPVVYFLDFEDSGGDIKYKPDGSVDAVATFTAPNADTSSWVTNGVPKGDNYGDALGAVITQSLGDYVAPRDNDDQTEGHRIEVFRLAQAGRKSDVRLRFASLGTDSWWFAVDNLAFYEDPAPIATAPRITSVTASAGNVTIIWTGGGTLESTPTLTSPTWTSTGDSDGSFTGAISGNKFFRVAR
jgi:hypothetical protein